MRSGVIPGPTGARPATLAGDCSTLRRRWRGHYALGLTPAALTIAPGATGTTTVNLTRTDFTGAVTLSLGNAPAGVTGSFTPAAPTGTSATLTLSVGAAVAPGVYNLTVNGSGSAGDRSTPLTLDVSIKLAAVSEGYEHSCALATTGAAYCWGYNSNGQLGDGTTTQRLVPTAVVGGLTFAAVSAGEQMTCGVTTAGAAYCWGSGALGDGTTGAGVGGTLITRLVPTLVAGGLTFAAVSAGGENTCGVTTSGAAYCWGITVGDGTFTPRLVPTAVVGGLTFATLSADGGSACGVTTGGAAYCWGNNSIGDGTTSSRLVPTAVLGGPDVRRGGRRSGSHLRRDHERRGVLLGPQHCRRARRQLDLRSARPHGGRRRLDVRRDKRG